MASFIKIPTEILQDKKLNHTQILLYGIIMSLAKKEGYCQASNKTLGDVIGVGIWIVQNSIKRLKDEGYISVEIEDNNKRKITVNGYVKYHRGVCEISQGGMGNITPNNNIEYISTKVDIIPPHKNEEKTDTSLKKKRTTNEQLLVGEKKEQFQEFWDAYPHVQGRSSRKDSIPLFLEHDAKDVILGAKILKRKVEAGREDPQYVKASERWLKRFTPLNEKIKNLTFKEIMNWHMNTGGDMRERMERLKLDFPDVDFKKIREEISEKNSLLHKLTFT